MRVLGQSRGRVVDADNHQRLHFAGADRLVGLLANLPGASGDKRSARIEEILSVLQIENRVSALRMAVVSGRNVDDQVALLGQVMAGEGAMKPEPRMRRAGLLSLRRSEQTLGGKRPAGFLKRMLVQ